MNPGGLAVSREYGTGRDDGFLGDVYSGKEDGTDGETGSASDDGAAEPGESFFRSSYEAVVTRKYARGDKYVVFNGCVCGKVGVGFEFTMCSYPAFVFDGDAPTDNRSFPDLYLLPDRGKVGYEDLLTNPAACIQDGTGADNRAVSDSGSGLSLSARGGTSGGTHLLLSDGGVIVDTYVPADPGILPDHHVMTDNAMFSDLDIFFDHAELADLHRVVDSCRGMNDGSVGNARH